MKKKSLYLFLFLFAPLCITYAQQIITDNTQQPNTLIQNLVGNNCATANNVSSSINGNINNIVSYGSFDRGTSNFPLQSGIVLSTGSVTSAGNTFNGQNLSEGEIDWVTDSDILDVLGIEQTLNATTIEFDFSSVNNFVAFKYLFASDEYQQEYPCTFKDVFAILIKRAGTADPYVNIAMVPGTTAEISTNTIRPNINGFCEAENEDFFQGYNLGHTNFNGNTTVFSATTTIIPNEIYQIKFVIADHIDERLDSAVFIEAEGFGNSIDLGPDQSICGNDLTLDANINNTTAVYSWFLNGNLIIGENNSTLEVNQSGIFNVEVSIPITVGTCTLSDTVAIEIIPFQDAANIADVSVCALASSNSIYDFDFHDLKDAEIFQELPSSNYDISYHLNQEDAQNDNNLINGIYQNTESNETIFVRIENLDGSCLQLGSFNINVNDAPNTLEQFADSCGGLYYIDELPLVQLSSFNFRIGNYEFDRSVTYFLSEIDAVNNENSVTETTEIVGNPEYIYARVLNNLNGCFSIGHISVNYLYPPDIGIDKFIYDSCLDPLYSQTIGGQNYTYATSEVTYNFTEIAEELEILYPGITIRPILGFPPNPLIITSDPIVTVNISVSFGDYCDVIIPFEYHKNLLFNLLGDIKPFYGCDDQSNDGILDFNLNDVKTELQSDYNIEILFYENEADRDNDANRLDTDQVFSVTNSEQSLFIKSSYEGCEHYSEVRLIVNPITHFPPQVTESCGDFNAAANTTQIAINPLINIVTEGPSSEFSVEFYLSETNANNQENEVTSSYNVVGNSQLFYTRIANNITGCFSVSTLLVNLSNLIDSQSIEPIIICDIDQDGISTVNLETILPTISAEVSNFNYTFYKTYDFAVGNRDPILNPQSYTTETTELFIKIELVNQNCTFILNFDVLIYNDPQLGTISNFTKCEANALLTTDFIFETKDAEIVDEQNNLEVLYFENEDDAINNNNSIDKTVNYQNNANPQTIYVRLQNVLESTCFKTGSFQVEVREAALFNSPSDIFMCDINHNGSVSVDLNDKVDEIVNGSTQNLEVSFHLTPLDANLSTNLLPLLYTTVNAQQLVYARILNVDSGCFEIVSFYINALALPNVNENQSLYGCANNYNYEQQWDLTAIELLILEGRQYGIELMYFESETDLNSNASQIISPENYTNIESPQTLFVKITNVSTGCFSTVSFELILNDSPLINEISNFNICDNAASYVNLLEINDSLVDDTDNTLISYYTNEQDAEANLNALNTDYNYINTVETIYVRVENSATQCYVVHPFQLIVNPPPVAIQPNEIIACDDDFDGFTTIDLSQQNSAILNGQNPNEFSVNYYNSEINAIENIDALNINYLAYDGEIIFVRVENNTTGCYDSTQFLIVINPLPVASIEDQVICLNNSPLVVSAETNTVTDTYLWSTNATTPEIEIIEIGTYSVTITNQFGCENTSVFNVSESETAIIDVVETINFDDPNNITVTVSGIGNYAYQLNDLPVQTSNVFANVPLGYNTIKIIDLNGCAQVTHEVLVIDAPKHFTPNDDGDFDTWNIVGVETLPGTVIYIFDRYGKILTELGYNTYGWDGTYNGHKMPSDDYWYVATVFQNGKSFKINGHFTLRR